MSTSHAWILCLVITFAASPASAQAPSKLSFQGRLTDNVGAPITNPSLSMTFALYREATKIWEETQSVNVEDGLYNVLLGAVVPIDTVKFDAPFELGVKVGADPEMTPRIVLAAAATARSLPSLYTYLDDNGAGTTAYNIVNASSQAHQGAAGAVVLGRGSEVLLEFGTVSGGDANKSGFYATVGGGFGNDALGSFSTIGGGHSTTASGGWATVGGGLFNVASGQVSTVSGGDANLAEGNSSTVAGGINNRASGEHAAVPGGRANYASGIASFAAGYKARAKHEGSFVWNDRSVTSGNDSLLSTAANQFIIRAAGGIGINRAPAGFGIHLKQQGTGKEYGIRTEFSSDTDFWETWIDGLNDYNFAYNGTLKSWIDDVDGSFNSISDAALKEDLQPYPEVLAGVVALRPSTYRFKDSSPLSRRSLGLIAQDVEKLFPELVSEKDGIKGVNYTSLSVVAVKAIQELHSLVEAQRSQIEILQAQVNELRATRN